MVLFGAAYFDGQEVATGVWTIIIDYKNEIQDSAEKAIFHVTNYVKEKGVNAISDLFSLVFTDILAANVINPVWTGAKNIVNQAMDLPSKLAGMFTETTISVKEPKNIIQRIAQGITQKTNIEISEVFDEDTISDATNGLIKLTEPNKETLRVVETIKNNKEINQLIVGQAAELKEIFNNAVTIVTGIIKEQGKKAAEKSAQTVMETLEKAMAKQGTAKIWNALKDVENVDMLSSKNTIIYYALSNELNSTRKVAIFFMVMAIFAVIFGVWVPAF